MGTERLTLSISETSKVLGIGRNLTYKLAKSGFLPVLRCGRRMVIPRAALDKLLSDPKILKQHVGEVSDTHG